MNFLQAFIYEMARCEENAGCVGQCLLMGQGRKQLCSMRAFRIVVLTGHANSEESPQVRHASSVTRCHCDSRVRSSGRWR
jgi:hypothetical protein